MKCFNYALFIHLQYSHINLAFMCFYRTVSVCVVTCVMDLLCDVNPLSVGQSSVHRSPCSRSETGVERVDIEAQVDGPLLPVREK